MTGVKELREGLQVSDGGLLRILKDFYGSTTGGRVTLEHKFCSLWNTKQPKNMEGLIKSEITLEHNTPGFLGQF